jgi:hypothetical protein
VNSDVAVGHVLGLRCERPTKGADRLFLPQFFTVDSGGVLSASRLDGAGFGDSKQIVLRMFDFPPTKLLAAAVAVHPIKTVAEFVRFHEQVSEIY